MRCIMVGTKSTHSTRCRSISASAASASKRVINTTVPPQSSCCHDVMNGPGVIERAGHQRRAARAHAVLGGSPDRSSRRRDRRSASAVRCCRRTSCSGPRARSDVGQRVVGACPRVGLEADRHGGERGCSSPAGAPTTRAGCASATMARRSRSGSRDDTGCGVAPSRQVARQAAKNSIELGSASVTRAPASTPRPA